MLYGAYEFLHRTLGFEIYAANEIALDTEVQQLRLEKFNVSDAPDILYRHANYGTLTNQTVGNRFRMQNDIWMSKDGYWVHNSFGEYFPKSKYGDNTDWYSDDMTQLCYTAHGKADELEKMREVAFTHITEIIDYFYSMGDFRESLSFSQEDGNTWCRCATCTKIKQDYGANSASVIKFLNPVARRVKEWMAQNWPGHSVNITFFAYVETVDAPVKSVDGKYVPVDDSVILEDNLALWYAPIYAQFIYDFNHEKNSGFMDILNKWNALTDKFYLWFYSTQFSDYLLWYDTFNSMQPIYRLAKEINAAYLFDQARYNTSALTAFDHLKVYLNSKLAWNVDADYNELIDNFFANYFRDAAGPMREYFESFRSWSQYLKDTDEFAIPGQPNSGPDLANAMYWPKQVLVRWNDCIEKAYKAIESLKLSDRDLYDKLYDRIMSESIAIRYHLIELHGTTYTDSELTAMKLSFKEDATRLGFTKIKEFGSLEQHVYSKWGV